MARRRGRAVSGWLIVDKPAGICSTDVVGRVRWALDARKAGHAGTLDPDATGLLAVALGEATKTVPYLTEALKAYDFTVNWGSETASDDASGAVTRVARAVGGDDGAGDGAGALAGDGPRGAGPTGAELTDAVLTGAGLTGAGGAGNGRSGAVDAEAGDSVTRLADAGAASAGAGPRAPDLRAPDPRPDPRPGDPAGPWPDADAIRAALAAFRGNIMQVPPAVSAVRVDGARAYDLAREGEAFELAARPLLVAELDLLETRGAQADFRMVCGKGGYVRAIARDLGRALGCLGHVATLRRVWSGPFDLGSAVTLDRIDRESQAALDAALLPVEAALDLPQMQATDQGAVRLGNGNPGQVLGTVPYGSEVWVSHRGRAIAIGRYLGGEVHPSRVFVPDAD